VRWVQFQEVYAARARAELSALLDETGFGSARRVDVSPPSYAGRAGFGELRARDIATAGVGFVPWLPPPDDDATLDRDRLLALLASGSRGFSLAMAVERDRYVGGAIDRDGRVQASWLAPLCAALADVEWPSLRRRAPIAVIEQRTDRRFGIASCLVDPLTPVVAELLGLGAGGAAELGHDAGALQARRWHAAVCRALELAQVPYAVVDEHATADELASYRAVIAPTIERCDRALWGRLRELADAKRTVVVIGPGTPVRDEYDRPLDGAPRRMGRLETGSLEDPTGLAEDLGKLAGDELGAWQVERPRGVRTAVFVDREHAARMIVVHAESRGSVTATLLADQTTSQLRDALTGECMPVHDGRVSVVISGARLLRLES